MMTITYSIAAGLVDLTMVNAHAGDPARQTTRDEVKEETRRANMAGRLLPAGEGALESIPIGRSERRGQW